MSGKLKPTMSLCPFVPLSSLIGTITFMSLAYTLPELLSAVPCVYMCVSTECFSFLHYFAGCIYSLAMCPSHLPH